MDTKEQIKSFLNACAELKNCKFIMATTNLKDLLKRIVNCSELYRLFEAVTKDFDYLLVKSKCLVSSNDGIFSKSYVLLPQTIGERLAFIFCLLVEFDRETVNFNDFLRVYYQEDGSYYAGYLSFCSQIIDSLSECIEHVFRSKLAEPDLKIENSLPPTDYKKAELVSAISLSLAGEISFIESSALSDDDKESAVKILSGLNTAVKYGDEELIDALLCGYNYFILYNKCQSDGIEALINLIVEYVGGETV